MENQKLGTNSEQSGLVGWLMYQKECMKEMKTEKNKWTTEMEVALRTKKR